MIGILHDVTRCAGCMRCVSACAEANDFPSGELTRFHRSGLSGHQLNAVIDSPEGRHIRRHCLHCLEPACVAACLVGALHRTPEGRVVYDEEKCIGCRYCMLACPFEIPRYEWDRVKPLMRKCELCDGREGGPACVAACPHDATMFGDRDELMEVARARVAAEPDKYLPHVWGAEEMGGTGVLFISDVSLDRYWPESMGRASVPDLTWPLAKETPFLAFSVAGLVSGLAFIIHRRNRLAAENENEGVDVHDS